MHGLSSSSCLEIEINIFKIYLCPFPPFLARVLLLSIVKAGIIKMLQREAVKNRDTQQGDLLRGVLHEVTLIFSNEVTIIIWAHLHGHMTISYM